MTEMMKRRKEIASSQARIDDGDGENVRWDPVQGGGTGLCNSTAHQ